MGDDWQNFTETDSITAWTSSGDITSSTDAVPKKMVDTPKRPFAGNKYGEPPAKRAAPSIRLGAGFKWNLQMLAHAADAVESGGKSPVSALNELGVRVTYSVLRQAGPAHCPCFNVAVKVADMTFEGGGHSKREARAAAARACLAALLARAGRVLPAPSQHQDFTSDEMARFPVSEFQCLETKANSPSTVKPDNMPVPDDGSMSTAESPAAGNALFGAGAAPAAHKSPINLLYENYPGLTFHCTFGDGSPLDTTQAPMQLSHSMRFKVVCLIKDQKFEGYGSSKKLAKLAAARSALAVLEDCRVEPAPASGATGFLPQNLADHIGKLVNEKFNELMRNDLVHSKRKVLAGIVMTIDNKTEGAKVIAVTTGTKCVSGEHMSVTGRAVNDCHAEVAARRCLQRHLYSQLLMYASQADPRVLLAGSDLEPAPGGGYQLKPDRRLHLYVSTAPCGDGRIFSPHEKEEMEPDKHPNRLARGQLRTKIESGEGTIPVKNCSNVIQTWDGVMQGERLLTMSCSDKVARWCVAGLQGALLARLLKPVYLHSLVLGSLLHPHHMYRAICGRIETYISSLPPPFRLHRPLLARAASTEARTPARAPSFSVCWSCTTPVPEVINATTGKLETGQPSLLCKQSMFARWQYLVQRLPQLPQEADIGAEPTQLPADLTGLLYNEAKQLCPAYQIAKQCLIESFDRAKLGRWIKKPLEQDQFVCEIVDAEPSALFAWAGRDPRACHAMQGGCGVVGGPGAATNDTDVINDTKGIVRDVFNDMRGKVSDDNGDGFNDRRGIGRDVFNDRDSFNDKRGMVRDVFNDRRGKASDDNGDGCNDRRGYGVVDEGNDMGELHDRFGVNDRRRGNGNVGICWYRVVRNDNLNVSDGRRVVDRFVVNDCRMFSARKVVGNDNYRVSNDKCHEYRVNVEADSGDNLDLKRKSNEKEKYIRFRDVSNDKSQIRNDNDYNSIKLLQSNIRQEVYKDNTDVRNDDFNERSSLNNRYVSNDSKPRETLDLNKSVLSFNNTSVNSEVDTSLKLVTDHNNASSSPSKAKFSTKLSFLEYSINTLKNHKTKVDNSTLGSNVNNNNSILNESYIHNNKVNTLNSTEGVNNNTPRIMHEKPNKVYEANSNNNNYRSYLTINSINTNDSNNNNFKSLNNSNKRGYFSSNINTANNSNNMSIDHENNSTINSLQITPKCIINADRKVYWSDYYKRRQANKCNSNYINRINDFLDNNNSELLSNEVNYCNNTTLSAESFRSEETDSSDSNLINRINNLNLNNSK